MAEGVGEPKRVALSRETAGSLCGLAGPEPEASGAASEASATRKLSAVVVLGHPARRSGRPHPVQRARVNAAVAVFRAVHADRIVMCGGARKNSVTEADVMVELARAQGVDAAALVAERSSTTTWENVREAAPLVRDCAAVHIVSEPLHAARARRYWLAQFPADADRVFVTLGDAGTRWWIAIGSAVYEIANRVRDRIVGPVRSR